MSLTGSNGQPIANQVLLWVPLRTSCLTCCPLHCCPLQHQHVRVVHPSPPTGAAPVSCPAPLCSPYIQPLGMRCPPALHAACVLSGLAVGCKHAADPDAMLLCRSHASSGDAAASPATGDAYILPLWPHTRAGSGVPARAIPCACLQFSDCMGLGLQSSAELTAVLNVWLICILCPAPEV